MADQRRAKRIISNGDLRVSPTVLLDLEFLYEVRRTKLPARDVLLQLEHETMIQVCDLPFPVITRIAVHESWEVRSVRPHDCGRCKANGLAFLIAADEQIAKHYPRTIW